jgi:hypothetical protein
MKKLQRNAGMKQMIVGATTAAGMAVGSVFGGPLGTAGGAAVGGAAGSILGGVAAENV